MKGKAGRPGGTGLLAARPLLVVGAGERVAVPLLHDAGQLLHTVHDLPLHPCGHRQGLGSGQGSPRTAEHPLPAGERRPSGKPEPPKTGNKMKPPLKLEVESPHLLRYWCPHEAQWSQCSQCTWVGKAELDTWCQSDTCVVRPAELNWAGKWPWICSCKAGTPGEGGRDGWKQHQSSQDVGSRALQAADLNQGSSLGLVGHGVCLSSTRQTSAPALRPSPGLLTQKAKHRAQKGLTNLFLP